MADTKISALPASTTPLAGTESVPIVQSGVTKQVSVANLTAGRAVGSAGGTFTDNHIQGTAAKGINFTANTPAAGMTSQLLNWYEEGTWTPVLTRSVTNPTITSYLDQAGTYTRIGNRVFISCPLRVSISAAGSGDVVVSGLPFAAAGKLQGVSLGLITVISSFGAAGNYVSGTDVIFNGASLTTGGSYLTFSCQYDI